MKTYGVKEVAKLSGVSIRTLHHYDKIGLLKPKLRTEAAYRHYGEEELLRLQQILFYKELDFPLKEIKEILDDPDFDLVAALQSHKKALRLRRKRIAQMLTSIDQTIHHLQIGESMKDPGMLYEGLPEEMGGAYRKEAIDAYGKEEVEHAEQELLKMGKQGFKQLQADFEQLNKTLFEKSNLAPEGEEVQALIAQHYVMIRKFWGTSQKEDKQAEAYAGLGELYISDSRFTQIDGNPQPVFAAFLQKAMRYFADTQLK